MTAAGFAAAAAIQRASMELTTVVVGGNFVAWLSFICKSLAFANHCNSCFQLERGKPTDGA